MRLRNSRRAALAALATISFASVGAGVATATTPPSEPTDDTTMTSDVGATDSSPVDDTTGTPAGATGPLCAALEGDAGSGSMTTDTMPTDTMATDTMATDMATSDTMATSESSATSGTSGDVTTASTGTDMGAGAMTDSPVATAVSMSPLLTILSSTLGFAGLTETLDSGEAFTVLAPVDSAFAKVDPVTVGDAMNDATGLLASILSYHVIPEQLSSEDLLGGGSFETVLGDEVTFEEREGVLLVNGGEAAVQCMDIPTANATVFLIDTVLMPPSLGAGGDTDTATTTGASTAGSTPTSSDATGSTDAGADTDAATATTGG